MSIFVIFSGVSCIGGGGGGGGGKSSTSSSSTQPLQAASTFESTDSFYSSSGLEVSGDPLTPNAPLDSPDDL
jgi:hypothetical protein